MARILIIDDEHNIRMMVGLALKSVGHTVTAASDGPEGIERFGNGTMWDLVLLDQRMPEMDGLEVLHELRAKDESARIIMITAFGTIDLAVDAMKAGAVDFLRKPFSTDTLRGAVEVVLRDINRTSSETEPLTVTFGLTTINGYGIESNPKESQKPGSDYTYHFVATSPAGVRQECTVKMPTYIIELVKAHTSREHFPGGDRFWQALCEEVLANYVWQNADFPPDNTICIDDLNMGLRRWIDSIVAA